MDGVELLHTNMRTLQRLREVARDLLLAQDRPPTQFARVRPQDADRTRRDQREGAVAGAESSPKGEFLERRRTKFDAAPGGAPTRAPPRRLVVPAAILCKVVVDTSGVEPRKHTRGIRRRRHPRETTESHEGDEATRPSGRAAKLLRHTPNLREATGGKGDGAMRRNLVA